MDKQQRYIEVVKGATEFITTIPVGKKQVFIEVDADADFDMKVTAADGEGGSTTVLLEYSPNVHWSFTAKTAFSYNGMEFEACVDGCTESKKLVYHDNTTFRLIGSASYSSEWLFINTATEELTLEIEGYQGGSGTVYWLWDCPDDCAGVCTGVLSPTEPPTQAPSVPPTYSTAPSAVPSRKPTYSTAPTLRPSKQPTLDPTALPTLEPTALPTLEPTAQPTLEPTALPTLEPTMQPTLAPTTLRPSPSPSQSPTPSPSLRPSLSPSKQPTLSPSRLPTLAPTSLPSTLTPTPGPSSKPTSGSVAATRTSAPSAMPTTAPVAFGARRSVTDCSVTDEDVIWPFFGSVFGALIVGALVAWCLLRKVMKANSKVTPTITADMHSSDDSDGDDDDDDEHKGGDGIKDNAGGIRPPDFAGRPDVFKQMMAARKAASKLRTLHDLKMKQKQAEKQLAERMREEKLDEMEELPFDGDADEHGLVHELASLKNLHDREISAIHGLYDLKRAAEGEHQRRIFGDKRNVIIKRNEEAGTDPADELEELEQEREAARNEIEAMLGKLERDAINAEVLRQNQQTKAATGDGSAFNDEVRLLKERMAREQLELLQARQDEQKRRQQALRSRLDQKQKRVRTDMQKAGSSSEEIGAAMTALDEEGNREVAAFELECAQENTDLLMKDRQREITALGEMIDPSEEVEWLKRKHQEAKDALDKTLEAEGARRRAKLAERMSRRRTAKKAGLLAAGVPEGSDQMDSAMAALDSQEAASLEQLEGQMQNEADFYAAQLEQRLENVESRHLKFNDDVRKLQEEEMRRRLEVEEALRTDHAAKTAALMERLKARRTKKCHEMMDKDPPATAEEISEELERLNEGDIQELFDLQQSMKTALSARLTEDSLTQKADMDKLTSADAAVAAVMDFDNAELRRLVDKHAKDRAALEEAIQAKRKDSSNALKKRLAEKRARKRRDLESDGASEEQVAEALQEIAQEEMEALEQLEKDATEACEEQWSKVSELSQQQLNESLGGAKASAVEIEANLGELREKHEKAMAKLDKELDAKRKEKQSKLAERLKKKRAKQEKKKATISEEESSKGELELIEEESKELAEIEQELGEEKRQLQLEQKQESDERVASLNEERMKQAAEKAAEAAAAREQALSDAAAIKAAHQTEMEALSKQLEGEQKKKQHSLKDRLAKRRNRRAQELSRNTGQSKDEVKEMLDKEEKKELDKLTAQEAERAAEIIDSKLKEQEAEETDVAMRVMAANNDLEAEAAAKRKNEMYKKILGKEAFDAEEEGRKVREMLTKQQQEAERFEVEIERNLKHHHLSLADRVKRRRQRRESKAQVRQETQRNKLFQQQTSDLRELHATMVAEGNHDEANLAAREEIQMLTNALEDAKHDRDQLREKVGILSTKLDEYEDPSGGGNKDEALEEANLQVKHLHSECDKLHAQASDAQAKLQEKVKRIEGLEQEVTELEMNAKGATSAIDSEEVQAMLKDKELEIEDLSRDNQAKKERLDDLQGEVEDLKKAKGENEAEMERLRELAKRGEELEAAEAAKAAAEDAQAAAEAKKEEMFTDLRKEQVIRKKLHNELEDMKGAIRVFARGRPLSKSELDGGYQNCIDYLNPTSLSIMDEFTRGKDGPDGKQFVFDSVFDPSNSQDDVFEDTKQLLESVLDGYNVCIFAYGQTGSGKTFTMNGVPEQPGITPRCITQLFDRIDEMAKFNTVKVTCYFVELYNDTLVDLFLRVKDKKAKPGKLEVKLNKHKQVYVKGAVEMTASSAEELQSLFDQANRNRHVSSTAMNSESSRSHSIFGVVVENLNRSTKKTTYGKLSLIDLAGSERAAKTKASKEQLKEATSINQSLAALGNVIAALTEGEDFIPYRNNKLTMLMQDSLGGNAKTLMFVNFSPADYNVDETNGSLTYGTRVKAIKNKAVVGSDGRETAKLKAKVRHLKEQLASSKGGGGGGGGGGESLSSGSESSESEGNDQSGSRSNGAGRAVAED